MAHWQKDPREIQKYSEDELDAMEQAFLLLEKRQTETLETIIGSMLGTTWDVDALLASATAKKGKHRGEEPQVTWSRRDKKDKLFVPLVFFMTQNTKLMKQLQTMATDAKKATVRDPSIINVPTWYTKSKKEEEVEMIDLSESSKEDFLRWAGTIEKK